MVSLRRIFTFSGQKFYKLFDNVADNMQEMANMFLQVMYDDVQMQETHIVQLERIEHANDETTHRLFVELGKNFITPFDREDIHDLATSLDDVIDFMYSIGRKLQTFAVGQPEKSMQLVATQVSSIVKELSQVVKGLKNKNDLISLVQPGMAIKQQVYEADHSVDMAVASLLAGEPDAIELLKKMELYDSFQYLLEKCGSVINSVESVIIKYS
jgi:uncharacterized protein